MTLGSSYEVFMKYCNSHIWTSISLLWCVALHAACFVFLHVPTPWTDVLFFSSCLQRSESPHIYGAPGDSGHVCFLTDLLQKDYSCHRLIN